MKIHGKKGKNFLLEVTPYELGKITTALAEWDNAEAMTVSYDRGFSKVYNRISKAQQKFESLPLIKEKKLLE